MSTETLETAPALSHDNDGSPIIRLPYSVDLLAGMFAVQLHCADRREPTPVNWPLSARMRRFAGTFTRGFSYTGQPSRLATMDEGVSE